MAVDYDQSHMIWSNKKMKNKIGRYKNNSNKIQIGSRNNYIKGLLVQTYVQQTNTQNRYTQTSI